MDPFESPEVWLDEALRTYKKATGTTNVCELEALSEGIGGLVRGDKYIDEMLGIIRPYRVDTKMIELAVDLKFQARHEFLKRLAAVCQCTMERR